MSLEPITKPEEHLRPEVLRFALIMERQLRANDAKPGWDGDAADDLFARAEEELIELGAVLRASRDPNDARMRRREIAREAADIANFCMMIADVSQALPEATRRPLEPRADTADVVMWQTRLLHCDAAVERFSRQRDQAEVQVVRLRSALERIDGLYQANDMSPLDALLAVGRIVRGALDACTPPRSPKASP